MSILTKKEKRMKAAITSLTHYMVTYGYDEDNYGWTDKSFINDVLYGLGVALHGDKYKFANGYDEWKKELIKHLNGGK